MKADLVSDLKLVSLTYSIIDLVYRLSAKIMRQILGCDQQQAQLHCGINLSRHEYVRLPLSLPCCAAVGQNKQTAVYGVTFFFLSMGFSLNK